MDLFRLQPGVGGASSGLLPARSSSAAPSMSASSSASVGASAAVRDAKLDPKLVAAAHQFEASLMNELLKPLTSGDIFGGDGEGEDGDGGGGGGLGGLTSSGEGSGGALMSFGSEALAKALSEKGGLGIARRVLDHFEAAGGESGAGKAKTEAGAEPAGNNEGAERDGREWDGKSSGGGKSAMERTNITKVI